MKVNRKYIESARSMSFRLPVAILIAAMLSLVAVTTEGESETGSEHFGPQMLSIQLR